jgi:nucleotide-binding universal stress UspA family protein
VTVVECATSGEADAARARLEDVQTWLRRHRVMADIRVATTDPGSRQDAAVLVEACLDRGADLVVAGAYGHSRLREWALGGVTRDLLMRGDRCVFLSR